MLGLETGLKNKLNLVLRVKYKLNKTFCHLILGFQQFFSPQEQLLSEPSYDMKILWWEIHLDSGSGALTIKWISSSSSLPDIIVNLYHVYNTDRPRLVNNIFFKELNKCLLKEPEWFRTSIHGKTLPAINWEKFWRVDSIEDKGWCKLKREASPRHFYLRKDKGNWKGFQAIFATWLSWRCFL